MKIELSHDTLAKTVYERASANDRMRLHLLNLIRTKYHLYELHQTLLTVDDVKAIAPFEDQLILTANESAFLRSSKIRANKNIILFIVGAGIATLLVIGTLLWFLSYTVSSNNKLEESNKRYQESKKVLEIKLAELHTKDSIQTVLLDKIGKDEEVINMTNKELQDALKQLQVANEALASSKKALEKERDKLKEDTKGLQKKLTKQASIVNEVQNTRAKLNAIERSQQLSQYAYNILQEKKLSEKEYKEAFRLARYAWNLSRSNSQAMDILNVIGNKKIRRSNNGFLSKERPKNTYTHSKIERIIQNVDAHYKYGQLTEKDVNDLLR